MEQDVIYKLYNIFTNSNGVSTDSRSNVKDKIFFALKGTNFDGNDFAKTALDNGACCVVVSRVNLLPVGSYVLVEDTLKTLQELAKYHRKHALKIPVVAITGSNGKTTTKELCNKVLSSSYRCYATPGNLNNHIGVPLSILSITQTHQIALIELGANHLNEIRFLCEIAQPNIGIITSIGKDHLEGYGSIENIKQGTAELLDYLLKNDGLFIQNIWDNQVIDLVSKYFNLKKYHLQTSINFKDSNDFIKIEYQGELFSTQLFGEYNKPNILIALALGEYFNIPLKTAISAIARYIPQSNRSQIVETTCNWILLDAYNANPTSMEVAIKSFFKIESQSKGLILGDMAELGNYTFQEHLNIIRIIHNLNFEFAFLCGKFFFEQREKFEKIPNLKFFKDKEELIYFLKNNPLKNKKILIKGSRNMKMEDLISYL
jgi:UDP-N-acetylmuramoyl-tripeptide--D-alanyl-D-alanine ligase